MTHSNSLRPPRYKRTATLALVVCSLLSTRPAAAESAEDVATGRALFKEARALLAAGKYGEACPKFEESLRLNRGIGTQFNLADCWEHLGRTASAWGLFLEVAAGARATGQGAREQVARERAATLEPKLPHLVIETKSRVTGMEIRRDGELVAATVLGVAVPVDPGAHLVEVTAKGKRPFSVTVALTAGKTLTVEIPELTDEAPAATPVVAAAPAAAAASEPTASDVTPKHSSAWSTSKTLALVSAGVGVAGAVVGTVFFTQYSSANADAKKICADPTASCPEGSAGKHDDLTSSAKTDRTLTYVGWGVGLAGLTGAAILWFTAPKHDQRASGWRFTAGPAPVGAGVTASVGSRW